MFFVEIDGVLHSSTNLPPTSNNPATIDRRERRKRSKMKDSITYQDFERAKAALETSNTPYPYWVTTPINTFELAPLCTTECQPAQAKAPWPFPAKKGCKQKEGKNPMRYNDNTAIASVTVQKSDAAVQREYFLSRLRDSEYPKREELAKTFHINVCTGPENFAELIDMIKNDKFKINKKAQKKYDDAKNDDGEVEGWYYGPLWGIEFIRDVMPDNEGYFKAINEMDKQMNTARDQIMSGDAAAMAKAVADFEAWTPVGNAS